ncbi:hypothetical protein LNO81_31165 [Klebsiella variicola subsp. variicola]|nr:hypothetical protein [Klebsiella variicola subsp. variicola]
MKLGIISQIVDNRYTLLAVSPSLEGLSPGMTFALQDTYCQLVVKGTHHQRPQCGQASRS